MLAALIKQQFPGVEIVGESEKVNSGNFIVRTGDGIVVSPYGFVDSTERRKMLLQRIKALSSMASSCPRLLKTQSM